MSEFTIRIEGADVLIAALDPANLEAAVDRAGMASVIYLEGVVKQEITRFTKTSRLRSSIHHRKVGYRRWMVGTDVVYAVPVEEGSAPHVIRPRNRKALRFQMGGRTVFARSVNHPGFRGHHYMRLSVDRSREAIGQIFRREIERSLGR